MTVELPAGPVPLTVEPTIGWRLPGAAERTTGGWTAGIWEEPPDPSVRVYLEAPENPIPEPCVSGRSRTFVVRLSGRTAGGPFAAESFVPGCMVAVDKPAAPRGW